MVKITSGLVYRADNIFAAQVIEPREHSLFGLSAIGPTDDCAINGLYDKIRAEGYIGPISYIEFVLE